MKVHIFVKLFLIFILLHMILMACILGSVIDVTIFYRIKIELKETTKKFSDWLQTNQDIITIREEGKQFKYILQWTSPNRVPFVYMGKGQKVFIDLNCKHKNCFVTSDRNYLGDYTKFDVIAFSGPEVINIYHRKSLLPLRRSPHQKYVFATFESAANFPVCSNRFDGYFNWTWTYRLDSDSKWGYVVVRDANDTIIGPKKEMHWMKLQDMDPVKQDLREKLRRKQKLAAWFVSACQSQSKREVFVKNLNFWLKQSGHQVDIYGNCSKKKCPPANETKCDEMIGNDYFFYLAFENSLSEDYVTEKLVRALNNNAIPVVFGGANYTRYMPDGIYLDARKLGSRKLAMKMLELMKDFDKYVEYFRWKNHYNYHRRGLRRDTNDYCGFCEMLNDERRVKQYSVYENFREWWDPPRICDFGYPGRATFV